jgi:hypothetical protein
MTAQEALFNAYRGKRLLLDANLLLLFLIGTFDRSLIARFKRTAGFSANDFDVLANILPFFSSPYYDSSVAYRGQQSSKRFA